jgi:N-acetylmuramoyl-L-alanine amidase
VSRKIKERQGIDMTAFKKQMQRHVSFFWGLAMLSAALTVPHGTSGSALAASDSGGTRVIVIDPGHGGHDRGAESRGGEYEKDITLLLALAMADALRPDYRVVLTRTGDYHLDLARRASAANQHRADLFISLHLGGSRQQHVNAWEIYTFGDHPDMARRHGADAQVPVTSSKVQNNDGILWREIQPRHETAGLNLAECLKSQFQSDLRIPAVEIRQAPLRVLQGVDAPAVVLEAGYLTNPAARDALKDPRFLSDVGIHIRKAVDAYFQSGK